MRLTPQEQAVIAVLVEKELESLQKEKVSLSNSPVLGKTIFDNDDAGFLKSRMLYRQTLEQLWERLKEND